MEPVNGLRLETETGAIVAEEVAIARRARERVRGLRGRKLASGQALILVGTRQVHTFGLGYAIDVVFLDGSMTVLHAATLPPRRVSRLVWRARVAVELPVGGLPAGTRRLRLVAQPGISSIPVSNAS